MCSRVEDVRFRVLSGESGAYTMASIKAWSVRVMIRLSAGAFNDLGELRDAVRQHIPGRCASPRGKRLRMCVCVCVCAYL